MTTKLTLTNASAGPLQDAWHYAQLILDRSESTFEGDAEYSGIRGQVKAFEHLIERLAQMTEPLDDAVKALTEPKDFVEMLVYTRTAFQAIMDAAQLLGIDARTGEKPE